MLGEGSSGPACSTTVACILYIGDDQTNFTAPHVWSQFFYVKSNSNDLGGSPGDGCGACEPTTTMLGASPPGTVVDGQSVTLTATVTSTSPCTPSGTVTFLNGTNVLGTGPISAGSATLTTSSLPGGTLSLTASFPGDASTCLPSTSSPLSYVVTSPNSGDQIPMSAQSVGTVAAGTPFSSGQGINVVIPPNDLFNGTSGLKVLECSAPGFVLPMDSSSCDGNTINGNTLFANANGSVNFQTATGSTYPIYALPDSISLGETSGGPVCNDLIPCVLYIGTNQNDFTQPHLFTNFFFVHPNADDLGENPGDGTPTPMTGTTLTTSTPSGVFGQTDVLTATVITNVPSTCTPSGTVTFKNGSTTLGTGTISNGSASFSSVLPIATYSLTAVFPAGSGCAASTSPAVSYVVSKAATTTGLNGAPTSGAVFSQSVTFTATIAVVSPGAGTPSGTVTFKDGTNTLGSPTVSGGTATFTTSLLGPGSHTITATYSGDGNFTGSTQTLTYNVALASTTTVLSVPSSSSVFGQSVTFTATVAPVSPATATPTGTVTFKDGATIIGTAQTLSGGMASVTTSSLAVASHTITATYSGDSNDNGSTGMLSTEFVVNQARTTTGLGAVPSSPTVFGQSITFTATVTASAPGAGTPTGTVTFKDGATTIGTGPLAGGIATLTTSTLPVGSGHSITATYGGDTNFLASPASTAVPYTVNQAATTTALGAAPTSPSVFGQSVTFTATVTANSPGAGTPTGTVTFKDGATTIGTPTLSGGVATLTTATLALGSHSITATYGGDSDFAASPASTAVPYTVNQAATTTGLSSVPSPSSVIGQSVIFTAVVHPTSPGAGTPTGTVTFKDGATTIGTAQTLSGGTASVTTSTLTVATHSITVVYSGDGNFTISTSSPESFTVNQAASASAVISSLNPANPGASVTFTDTVTVVAPGAGTLTGTVTFKDGTTTIGTAQTLSGGTASVTTSTLSIGSHAITAVYSGDGNFSGSTSNTLTQVVSQYASATALTSSPNPSKLSSAATFTATVTPAAPATGTPTGSVAFRNGATLLGTSTLNAAGVATLTTSSLTTGTHSITAVYGGDATFASSTSAAVSQVVQASGGYWLVARDGGIFSFGSAQFYGSTGAIHLNQPIVGMAATPDGHGYWLVARDGGIFTFGDAQYHGSVPQILPGLTGIVGMVADPATGGYWIINSDGTIFNFDAPQDGTLPFFGIHVHNIVGGAATTDGKGLYLVGSDGHVYTMLGTATNQGSLVGVHLNAPIISMSIDPATGGYWLLGADGGVFSFNAPFFGSTGNLHLNKPVVGMTSTADGGGYWFVASDGGIFSFGDAVFEGSTGSLTLNQPVVGMASSG